MDILPQLVANSIIAGAIYMMVALGFNLIYGTVKFFDLGYGALATIGGYAVFLFYKKLGLDLSLSIALGVLLAGLIGYLVNVLVYKKLRDRKASNMVLIVASLGVLTVLQAIVAMIFSSQFQTLSLGGSSKVFEVFGAVITQIQLIILVSGLSIMTILAVVLKKTL
ncbi:MAG: hypothetical protein Q8O68_01085, partial [Candidatus Daviesbacteria bacterium]|nr:hypothetical protein [Candidatus Daviesbacteria bacterium]